MSWQPWQPIVRREVWHGRPWLGIPVYVVSDEPELLVTYIPERAPFGFAEGDWPGGPMGGRTGRIGKVTAGWISNVRAIPMRSSRSGRARPADSSTGI